MGLKAVANWMLVAAILGLLGGCGSTPKQAFEKKETAPIKKIVLATVSEPNSFITLNANFLAFVPIVQLVVVVPSAYHSTQFDKMMREQNPLLGEYMARAIETKLRDGGYDIVPFSQLDNDAILHLQFKNVGYVSNFFSLVYKPWIQAEARLQSAKDNSQLYVQWFEYGGMAGKDVEFIPTDPEFHYWSFSALKENPHAAAEGLKRGVILIAKRLAEQLR